MPKKYHLSRETRNNMVKKNAERKNEQIFEQKMFWKNLELMAFA